MAVIKILFTADGVAEEDEVLDLGYKLRQGVDRTGEAGGEVEGGEINITLRSSDKSEARFGWMVDSTMRKDGTLEFYDSTGQKLKTLSFTDGYCVGYEETFKAFGDQAPAGALNVTDGAQEKLTLSCRKIEVEGESHTNTWAGAKD